MKTIPLHKNFNADKCNIFNDWVFDTDALEKICNEAEKFPFVYRPTTEDVEGIVLALMELGYMEYDDGIKTFLKKINEMVKKLTPEYEPA
jgi:hypothetical protein